MGIQWLIWLISCWLVGAIPTPLKNDGVKVSCEYSSLYIYIISLYIIIYIIYIYTYIYIYVYILYIYIRIYIYMEK